MKEEVSAAKVILQHAMKSEPAQMKLAVGKELGNRIMGLINARRVDVGRKVFGK